MLIQISDFTTLIGAKITAWYEAAVAHVPNFLLAVTVLFVFMFIARYIRQLVARIMEKVSDNISLVSMVSTLSRVAVLALGLFFALGILGLDKTVTSLLAGAGVVALAIGFAFQDLTANFISGTFITLQRPIQIGDVVNTNGFFGKVKSINLRSVIIDNFSGQEIEIPSKDIFQNPITNFSKSGERRMQVDCGVAYTDDLQKVQDLAVKAVSELSFVRDDKPVELHFTEFGDSSINFLMWFWIKQEIAGPPLAKSEAIKAIKKAFDAHDITIPFPIRTLEFTPNANSVEVSMLNGFQSSEGVARRL
jgi:small conductance mechanosensitive channel